MQIKGTGLAGTLESSDVMITLEQNAKGVAIELDSTVEKQFGDDIRRVITETLAELGVENARVIAVDKGALDCAIRARVRTAAYRAAGSEEYSWGGAVR